jgi:hypothetical protein
MLVGEGLPMMHARARIEAAAISLVFITFCSGAEAQPLNGAWSGVVSSVNPPTGVVTRSVNANAAALQMTVRWQCGQPTLCVVTGPQTQLGTDIYLMTPPSGATTPARVFVLAAHPGCAATYGPTARIGAWTNGADAHVAVQCFTVAPPLNIRPRPDLPPIRLGPINLPPELRNPTGDERPTPRNQLPPGTRPRP